jgi:hypothetical protein
MVWTTLIFLLILLHIESPPNKINPFVSGIFFLYGLFISLLHVFSAFTTFFQIHFGILIGIAMILEFWFAWKFKLKYLSHSLLGPYVFFHVISAVFWVTYSISSFLLLPNIVVFLLCWKMIVLIHDWLAFGPDDR